MSETTNPPEPDPLASLQRLYLAFRVLVLVLLAASLLMDVLLISGLVQVPQLSYSGGPCLWAFLLVPGGVTAASFRLRERTPTAWLAHVGVIALGCLLLCPALLGVPLLMGWIAPPTREAYGVGR